MDEHPNSDVKCPDHVGQWSELSLSRDVTWNPTNAIVKCIDMSNGN